MRVLLPLKNQAAKQNSPPSSPSSAAAEPSPDCIETEDNNSKESERVDCGNSVTAKSQINSAKVVESTFENSVRTESDSNAERLNQTPTSHQEPTTQVPLAQGPENESSEASDVLKSVETAVDSPILKRKADSPFLDRKPSPIPVLETTAKRQKQSDTSSDSLFASRPRQKKEASTMVEHIPRRDEEDNEQAQGDDSAHDTNASRNMRENTPASAFQENNPATAFKEDSPAALLKNEDEYAQFEAALKTRGLEIREQEGDGNCLFRAVSLQIYGDASSHAEVRRRCLDFMARDQEHFSQFVTDEPFQDYIRRKRNDGVHGNNPEIQAISELFNRPVEVFVPENGAQPLNIFHEEYKTSDAPIRLSYHDGSHYNAVIDPVCPTAGLGLGLPGLEPGLADRMQMAQAVEESDKMADEAELEKAREASRNDELQRALKESESSVDWMYKEKAMVLSDLEATEIDLEQAALVSSLESYNHNELGRKPSCSSGDSSSREARTRNETPSTFPSSSAMSSTHASAHAPVASVASAAAHAQPLQPQDEYPQTVQELVMNGFELSKVVHAYDLIGDNFDELLTFLMSSTTR